MIDLALSPSSHRQEPASVITAGGRVCADAPGGLTSRSASPSIRELIAVIGEEATLKLCDEFGGHSREVGRPALAIVEAIGLVAAKALRAYWGRGRIYIPRRALSPKARHALVRRYADEGLTRQAIAQRVKLSERQVYTILSRRPRVAAPPLDSACACACMASRALSPAGALAP